MQAWFVIPAIHRPVQGLCSFHWTNQKLGAGTKWGPPWTPSLLPLNVRNPLVYRARLRPGLVNFVSVVAYHSCLSLPAAFTQPCRSLLAEPCRLHAWTLLGLLVDLILIQNVDRVRVGRNCPFLQAFCKGQRRVRPIEGLKGPPWSTYICKSFQSHTFWTNMQFESTQPPFTLLHCVMDAP